MSGDMVVCVGRLRARCIELSGRTPLHSPPFARCNGGQLGSCAAYPLEMEIGCLGITHPPRTPWGRVVDRDPCSVSQACPRGRIGALVLGLALGCGKFCGRQSQDSLGPS